MALLSFASHDLSRKWSAHNQPERHHETFPTGLIVCALEAVRWLRNRIQSGPILPLRSRSTLTVDVISLRGFSSYYPELIRILA